MSKAKPFLMPTTYFAIPLGLGATAIGWFHASFLSFADSVGNLFAGLSIVSWLLFISLYSYKIVRYPDQVKAEWQCPVRFSFLALIPITTMLTGDLLYHWQIVIGKVLIWLGIVAQLAYAGLRVGNLWKGDTFTAQSTLPPFYLPSVAANFTSASSLAMLGYNDLAYLFFGAGLIAWLIFEPVLLQHLRTNAVEPTLRTTFGIILAPAFVGVSAYLAVNGGEVDSLAKILWGYGFLQLLFLTRLFFWISQKRFSLGLWAFSFGLASMINSATVFYHLPQFETLAMLTFIFANLMMLLLCLGTIYTVFQGKFWLK